MLWCRKTAYRLIEAISAESQLKERAMDLEQVRAFRKEATERGLMFGVSFSDREKARKAGKGTSHFFDINQGYFLVPHDREKILALVVLAKRYRQSEDEALLRQVIRREVLEDPEKPCKAWQRMAIPFEKEKMYVTLKQWLEEQGML